MMEWLGEDQTNEVQDDELEIGGNLRDEVR